MSDTVEGAAAGAEAHAEPTPEEVIAQLRGSLQERETEAATERQRREAAEARERQAGSAVVGAHEQAITAQLSAQESAVANARAKMTQARESGDLNAEADAIEALATARQNVNNLKGEQSRLAAQRAAPSSRQQQDGQGSSQQGQYSPAAQAWIARNPKFSSDRIYRSVAEGAHAQALESGITPDSPAYFAHLDATLAKTFGGQQQQGAGEGGSKEAQQQAGKAMRPPASSYGTPPSRGTPTNPRANADVNAIASQLGVSADDVKAFADNSGMKIEDYCKSQAQILEERRKGGTGGLQIGQDGTLR